jgi:ABC-type sugar transport system ATPase subunit
VIAAKCRLDVQPSRRLVGTSRVASTAVENLSGGQRQSVVVVGRVHGAAHRANGETVRGPGVRQSESVLELIGTLSSSGVAVDLISHNMQHVLDVCAEVLVSRHGRNVGTFLIPDRRP